MELAYIKVFLDWREATKRLKDAEKGRLIDALVAYANGEDPDPIMSGNEQYSFETFRLQIDRDRAEMSEKSKKRSEAGAKGNEVRWGRKNRNAINCDEEDRKNRYEEDKDKEKDKGITKDGGNSWDIPARETPDTLELYALRAFPHMTPNNVSEMVSYLDSLPEDLIRFAVDKTAEQGVTAYSYCRTILNRYVADGIHSVAEAREKDAEYERRRKAQAAKPAPVTENPLDHAKFY